jgi:hypothetical protein
MGVEAREVVGLDRSVEFGPLDFPDMFVGQAESLQHDDRFGGRRFNGELDVGKHALVMAMGHQQCPGLTGCRRQERVPVDEPNGRFDRVDTKALVRKVEK